MNQKGNEFKMEKHLLVTYSWSMNNIGDIGITPGLLNMIGREKEELPVKVFAWQTEDDPAYAVARDYLPRYKKNCEVLPMPFFDSQGDDAQESGAWLGLVSRWGKSKLESFRKGTLTSYESALLVEDILERFALDVFDELKREKPEAAAAIENAGFVYYNSGTTLNFGRLGVKNLWGYTLPLAMPLIIARKIGVPYGIGSQSFDALEWPMELLYRTLFADARFVYCRDTDSLNYLYQKGLTNKSSGYRPDSTFFFKGFDEPWADEFMEKHGLENENFMCLMLRVSSRQQAFNDPTGGAVSEERKHEHMRKVKILIEQWIQRTGGKVLICHETRDTLETAPEYLLSTLDKDTLKNCVYMDTFWTSEQAYSIFKRARLVTSMEMHSIIMTINVGTPVLHNPFDECGRKKFMLNDLGLGKWLVDIDSCSDTAMVDVAMDIHENFDAGKKYLHELKPALETRMSETLKEVWMAWKE
jgi:polysaccharide pyruvyl transferase WcaK-like protein